jgi:3-oxoacyl-[acyl-carrier protein] reductase
VDLGLKDKVAWVLGASSGLGYATAASMAREGARVAISSRDASALNEAADDISAVAMPLDVTDASAISATAARIEGEVGPVDILVSNAGGPPPGGFDDLDDDALYGAFALTTASAWRLAKAVVPSMKQRHTGCLVFLTSSSTKEVIPQLLLSNMMRAAVVGMAKTLSKELGPHGVRVLCVAPGRIETKRLVQLDQKMSESTGKSVEKVKNEAQARIPLARYGSPPEFGDMVAFLASERASYVTGINVVVDGGMLSGILS